MAFVSSSYVSFVLGRKWMTVHLAYGAARGNSGESRRIYLWQYPKRNLLHHTAFVSLGRWLRETATLQVRKLDSGRRRSVRTAYVELDVLDRVWGNHDPVAVVVFARDVGVNNASMRKVLLRRSQTEKAVGMGMFCSRLTLRWLMSYIYGAPILDVSRSHTTTQHSQ